MPLTVPPQATAFNLRILTRAFVRAIAAWNDFSLTANPDRDTRTRAAWAQRFFFVQGLRPTPLRLPTQAEWDSLKEVIKLRDAIKADAARSQLDPSRPRQFDLARITAELLTPARKPAMNYLSEAFGGDVPAGAPPADLSMTYSLDGMSSNGRSTLERCNLLTEAIGVMQADMIRADQAARAVNQQPIYSNVGLLLPDPNANRDQYEQAWQALDRGQPSNIYDVVNMAAGQPQRNEIYGGFPQEAASTANDGL